MTLNLMQSIIQIGLVTAGAWSVGTWIWDRVNKWCLTDEEEGGDLQ